MSGHELIEAAKAGDRTKVRDLLQQNPSLAAWRAPSGETPILAALYRGHDTLAAEIADVAAKADALDIFAAAALGNLDALNRAIGAGAAVTGYAFDGWTPLHLTAFFGRREAAVRLLRAGADVAAVSRNALLNTPLHAAVAGGQVELALTLLEQGADVQASDAGGHTALHIAAESGIVPLVQELLARGADPHAVDRDDQTPLSRAAARNHQEIIDLMNARS